MKRKWIYLAGILFFFLFIPSIHAGENPHAVKASKTPYDFKAGEGPLTLPSDTDRNLINHNQMGIDFYLKRDFNKALKHFQTARTIKPSSGIILYNEAITLDKLDQHKKAALRFQQARDHSKGNPLIINSPVLQAHLK